MNIGKTGFSAGAMLVNIATDNLNIDELKAQAHRNSFPLITALANRIARICNNIIAKGKVVGCNSVRELISLGTKVYGIQVAQTLFDGINA